MDGDFSTDMHAIMHTGEHLFARSLQESGVEVHVRKVETDTSPGTVVFREAIPIEKMREALDIVNEKIRENLPVSVHHFGSLSDAMKAFPSLRFNEERVPDTGPVRVVKIGDFDHAACKNKHVRSTGEIYAFAVTGVSYLGGETTVKFLAGREAVKFLVGVDATLVGVAYENNVDLTGIKGLVEKLKRRENEVKENERRLAESLLMVADGLVDLRGVDLSVFSRVIGKFRENRKDKYIVLFSDSRLIGSKGEACGTDLRRIGETLREKGVFVGDIRDDFISGKITDMDKFIQIVHSGDLDAVD